MFYFSNKEIFIIINKCDSNKFPPQILTNYLTSLHILLQLSPVPIVTF